MSDKKIKTKCCQSVGRCKGCPAYRALLGGPDPGQVSELEQLYLRLKKEKGA